MKIQLLLIAIFILFSTFLFSQEICDNAIDDDGDGLIDLNDEDCICNSFIESSLIPNPSFEDRTCCPTQNAELNCAVGWIQASGPTTDYVHICDGYIGNTSIPAFAPLPFVDGEGAVGFRDGEGGVGSNYKEYVGACLTDKMVIGTPYRLDFYIGFQDNVAGSKSINLSIFGATNCSSLPFGNGSISIGCPANTGSFDQLGSTVVSGSNEWVNVIMDFTPTKEYEVFAIGPSCPANPDYGLNPYFYVDRLSLAEVGEFGIPLEVSGSICEDNLVLSVSNIGDGYQWYKDGIALIGETNTFINLVTGADVEGVYFVVVLNGDECAFSQEYNLLVPPYYAPISGTICEDESFTVGSETMTTTGYYEITIEAVDGCDSIVQLTLQVDVNTYGTVLDTMCAGDLYEFYDISTTEAGDYQTIISNVLGCDSLITLSLTEITQVLDLDVPEEFDVELGDLIDIFPTSIDPALVYFRWFDEGNNTLAEIQDLIDFQAIGNITLYLESTDQYGCGILDTVYIRVDKSNIRLYIPNIFTPNDDGINDFFRFYSSVSLREVPEFLIFDRWGNKVYEEKNIIDPNNFSGWDGTFNNSQVVSGVYSYYLIAVFVDGSEQLYKGSVTIIR